MVRLAGVVQSAQLLKSVGEALQRAVGAGARVWVFGFVPSAKISAQAAALYVEALVGTPDAASIATLNALYTNASSLQGDLRDQGAAAAAAAAVAAAM